LNLKIDLEDSHVWPDASHIAMATIHVLSHHLSYGFKIHVRIFKRYLVGIRYLYGSVQAEIDRLGVMVSYMKPLYFGASCKCRDFSKKSALKEPDS
jgi:hypothetical protein